ncbi:MAG: VCBS repeat-containing protein, partial [Candidatus Acidiferrales bacterium]
MRPRSFWPCVAACCVVVSAAGMSAALRNPAAVAAQPAAIHFEDITQAAGIHFVHNNGSFGKKWLPETMGPGVAFLDYDNDGWQDILIVNGMDFPGHIRHRSTLALYHNNHDGTFTDVTKQAG